MAAYLSGMNAFITPDEQIDPTNVGPHWIFGAEKAAGGAAAGAAIAVASAFVLLPAGILLAFGVLLLGLLVIGLSVAYGKLVLKTTTYRLRESVLLVQTGIISQEIDAIRMAMVLDADIHRSLWDRLVGSGTLRIKMLDRRGAVFIRSVINPTETQRYILLNAAKFRTLGMPSEQSQR